MKITKAVAAKYRMEPMKAVAARIRNLCLEKDITPNALGHISGVSPSTIQNILNEKSKNPRLRTIKKLCDGFGITLCEFFSAPEFNGE